jgi:hypothetical protein
MMRGLLLGYTKGLPGSSRFRGSFTGINDFNTMISAMDDYFGTLSRDQELRVDSGRERLGVGEP